MLMSGNQPHEEQKKMKRILKKITSLESSLVFFDENGRVSDRGNLRGDVSYLRGDVSYYLRGDVSCYLRGNVSYLRGDVSGLRGDVSGLRGDVSYLRGDVDDAEISDRDREKGINISDLIEE
jgi:hypothetical protein